jgi:hypothetical protein
MSGSRRRENDMTRLFLTIAVFLTLLEPAAAVRVLEDVENSAELSLIELTLPATASGAVSYTACEGCRPSTHRLDSATQYILNGQNVTFAEFAQAATDLRANSQASERTFVGVYFDLETERVTRITLRATR